MRFSGAKIVPCPPYTPLGAIESSRGLRPSRALRGFFDSLGSPERGAQLVKKGFDKLVDGEASSPARCRASNLRFEPSAVSPRAKPENPKGFQPPCHPLQFLLESFGFRPQKLQRIGFCSGKWNFPRKNPPVPAVHAAGDDGCSRGLRPSRALQGFFDSLRE